MYKREQNLNILTKNKINLKINTINVQLTENYITLKKKTEDRYKWKDSPHSRNKRINIVKMSIPPKVNYRFTSISIKFVWNHQNPEWSKQSCKGTRQL